MKKPRSDSKLDYLSEEQQQKLCEWLLTPGLTYERVRSMMREDPPDGFGVHTNTAALSQFYQRYVSAYIIQRRAQAVGVAKEVGEALKKTPGNFSPATIDALEQKAFELANSPLIDPRSINNIFTLVLKAREQSLKERDIDIKLRRLEMLEKQTNEAKATASDSKLNAAQKAERIREIFQKQ
jgi:hypothetical protein